MINTKISERLKAAAGMLTSRKVVVDIGTDHAYLPIYLVLNNMCQRAIGMDVNKGPLETAKGNLQYYGVADRVELRLSNGFSNLEENEATSAVITGMGGELIVKILSEGMERVLELDELVLSAQSEIFKLRDFLNRTGFTIDNEEMILEDNKFYQILHVVKGQEESFSSAELKYGRCLIKSKNQMLKKYLELENSKYYKTLEGFKGSEDRDSVKVRIKEIEELIAENKEVLSQIC